MSQAIADLRHEHEAILSALPLLERLAARASGDAVAAADLAAFLDFLHEFVELCHHGKEGELLFPAMVKAGLAEHGGFVDELLAEHAHGRELLQRLVEASAPLQAHAFATAAAAYNAHLRAHIDKENTALLPMAERLLDSPDMAALQQAFAAHEERVIGHGRHARLHALLERLEAKYLG